jgi:hypothetical protein
MAATYNPGVSDKDRVRLLIGDTNVSAPRFTDEEIEAALVDAGGVYAASADLLESLAAKYATTVDLSVDGFSTRSGGIYDAFFKLAARYRAQAPLKEAGGLGSPVVDGISLGEIEAVASNPDRTPSAFTHDMLTNPPSYPSDGSA